MIKVTMALLADFASIAIGGKLNILGIFDSLHTPAVPVVIPHIYLVMRIEGDVGEAGKQYEADMQLIDDDGGKLLSLPGFLVLPQPPPGKFEIKYDQLFPFFNLKFERFGNYEFKIFINREMRASVPLSVARIEAPPQNQG
ncbi:MAG: hypothetical protein RDV48_02225 [Candidatus Eremiobacteraeota bacterium]|nr:hypothetical protein [Candidatus Eremiobacteraeota bacterium]